MPGVMLLNVLVFAFWIWMMIDLMRSDFATGTEKIAWVLVMVFLYGLGAALYWFIGRRRKIPVIGAPPPRR